ncbi:8-oxo-dGTP pyrophosphatase MutT (NUDIX family) [Halarchaeum rubridurum]|uniref:8-oxo-dGTP pyrophosphatase MutT (NUDIX family) n=1 Tax=Halarchaeum rubridurum TaxID=489911 RepID=A0A830FZY3_9EURY|nr:CoA pyrophosphatase [Halarchaeum rubridurum]MBP1955181.1 8-oxo-dGTP pyrophosphatase MutT (NUDIX family) [Halarchaeum rubridurum]GGM68289.1 coenzyme A pyrophosphatase [Halarchaeum rubridurum]
MDLGRIATRRPETTADAAREAAVLVPVVERADGPALLFTKRADHLGEHPGQMSFPGGGREPSDADATATALREADEEIGLRPEEARVVGRLDDIETVTDYAITPVVARVPDREYDPDRREVAEIAVLPLAGLLEPTNHELERRDHPEYGELDVHFFRVGGYTVWGATGRILAQFLELACGWERPTTPDRVVDPDAEP